jgi:hypothetical protein
LPGGASAAAASRSALTADSSGNGFLNAATKLSLQGTISFNTNNESLILAETSVSAGPGRVSVAFGAYGGIVLVAVATRSRSVRHRLHRWQVAVNQWIDAV